MRRCLLAACTHTDIRSERVETAPGIASIRGTLHDRDGKPCSYTTVFAAGSSAQVDDNGTFVLEPVAPGRWNVAMQYITAGENLGSVEVRRGRATTISVVIAKTLAELARDDSSIGSGAPSVVDTASTKTGIVISGSQITNMP